ncbi:unnamed protein product [Rhizoctonia solani]|uniref:Uncharacterized protein n=1 Tax=Rhizoctonia solani TaxID=456999 RepID=A0A8H2XH22_9AGAM|nr:unnamed protein product [Rhizoctonia solani]
MVSRATAQPRGSTPLALVDHLVMNVGHAEEPKNIIVWLRDNLGLSYFWKFFIDQEDEEGRIRQIVHRQEFNPVNQRETLVKRLGRRVGIQQQPELPTYVTAAAKAYEYVRKYYNEGDSVILLADSDVSPDAVIAATELLVKCLLGNKAPPERLEDLPHFEPGDAGRGRIPVKCVAFGVAGFNYQDQDVTILNETILAKFPASIEHVICWKCKDESFSSCSTVRQPTGHIKTKEVCFCPGDYPRWYDLQIHLTKRLIQYMPNYVPTWDEGEPTWVQRRLDQSEDVTWFGQPTNGSVQSRGERPVGVQSIELRKYDWENDSGRARTCLVWKSFYD